MLTVFSNALEASKMPPIFFKVQKKLLGTDSNWKHGIFCLNITLTVRSSY